jgi:hypothetical protein
VTTKRVMSRRAGFLFCFFTSYLLSFAAKADGRSRRGRRWKNPTPLFKAVLLCLAAGCKGLTEAEELMHDMPPWVRKMVGIRKAIADTTLRTFLCKAHPVELCKLTYIVAYDAWKRGAIRLLDGFPFHAVSLDAKYPSVSDVGRSDNHEKSKFLQVHHDKETKEPTHGLVRTVTATLVTAVGRPVIGVTPIPGDTNEKGSFKKAFGDLVRLFGRRFKRVMYDAGATCRANADAVIAAGKHYLFQIADPRWQMYKTVELLFEGETPTARDFQVISEKKKTLLVRELTVLPLSACAKDTIFWPHTRSLFKVHNKTYVEGVLTSTKTRYFVCSMEPSALTPEKGLALIVLRWGVETCHQVLDMENSFEEDKHPWIHADANGTLVVQILRRVVFTLLTLYRSVTLRNEEESISPWRRHLEWIKDTLKCQRRDVFEKLRTRRCKVPPALI